MRPVLGEKPVLLLFQRDVVSSRDRWRLWETPANTF